ncbi:hypothetical protein B0H14DRAFT_3856789 [Mycena olivaceomarginata]|nr:hypothetical protein B0H14DRAFT_3856789 [Mycena olivaceomarginata]
MKPSPVLPVLPSDLERTILEICALALPVSIPKLMLVARRVKLWLEPLLYRTIVIFAPTIRAYPRCSRETIEELMRTRAHFLHSSVRNLMIGNWDPNAETAKRILSACRRVENLYLLLDETCYSALPELGARSLKRLHFNMGDLFGPSLNSAPPFIHPIFSQITHLELFHPSQNPDWSGLALLPCLTHLAFDGLGPLASYLQILQTRASLRMLIVLLSSPSQLGADFGGHTALISDPRFVVMTLQLYFADWQIGIQTKVDFWMYAADFIAQRWSGEVNRLQNFLSEDPSVDYTKYVRESDAWY